jgi:prevent-host-death family protein
MAETSATVGAYEAKTHFSELLGRVEAGEEVTITRHGAPIAKLIPVQRRSTPEERRAAFEAMKRDAAGRTLGGLKIKDLISEGRR